MSFGYYNNNNQIAVQTGSSVDSSFNTTFKGTDLGTLPNNSNFKLNGVDIVNYITPFVPGYGTSNDYFYTSNGANFNTLFSFTKPKISVSSTGALSEDTNYKYYAFTNTGSNNSITMTFPTFINYSFSMQILLIAGGGSGGNLNWDAQPGSGGGGAGNFVTTTMAVTRSILSNNQVSFSMYIGAGGNGVYGPGDTATAGNHGENSGLNINNGACVLTVGGGQGGHAGVYNSSNSSFPRGSSGGAGGSNNNISPSHTAYLLETGYTITSGQSLLTSINEYRNDGGTAYYFTGGGGGGGAGARGQNVTNSSGGTGGAGRQWINGATYAGGGGGVDSGAVGGTGGAGGSGGGGAGANRPNTRAVSGTANTGSGGGASWINFYSGNGGSGICIIAIPIADYNKYFT